MRQLRGHFNEGIRKYLDVRMSQSHLFNKYKSHTGSADITFFRSSTFMKKPFITERWASLTTGRFTVHDIPEITHEKLMMTDSEYWPEIAEVVMQSRHFKTDSMARVSKAKGRLNNAERNATRRANSVNNVTAGSK